MKLDPARSAALLEPIRRGSAAPEIVEAHLGGAQRCGRGIEGVRLDHVRFEELELAPGLLRGGPVIARARVDDTRFDRLVARRTTLRGLRAGRVRIDGPWDAFTECIFEDVEIEDLVLSGRVRFDRCQFLRCRIGFAGADDALFLDCVYEDVTFTGTAGAAFFGRYRGTDMSALRLTGAIDADRERDLRLPNTPDAYFVPRRALEGELAPLVAAVQNDYLYAMVNPTMPLGQLITAAEAARHGAEAEMAALHEHLWPHRITNLADA